MSTKISNRSAIAPSLLFLFCCQAIDRLTDTFLADAVLRAVRLERQSWYHFGDEEQERIERIFRIFRVGPSMHRKEV